ncbi:MAG TPA: AlpA family phage regulatory protein [Rhodocyclaceae bacterium]|nr:AlpA family phage regulatory protein [Rhodocyclaceae bacterium]
MNKRIIAASTQAIPSPLAPLSVSLSGIHGRIPDSGYIRQVTLIGSPAVKATDTKPAMPAVPGIVPFSSATLWRKVKAGQFPRPVKLSDRITAWRAQDVAAWLHSRSA